MNKKLLLIAIGLCCIAAFNLRASQPDQQARGGWSEWKDAGIDYDYLIDSPQHISAVAVRKALQQKGLKFLIISQYQTQIVSGLNVRVRFQYLPNDQQDLDNVKQGEAVVYYQSWNLQNSEPKVTELHLQENLESSAVIAGGWSDWKDFGVDYKFSINSPERIADLTVSKGLKAKGLQLLKMVRFQTQIVNGIKIRATFNYAHFGENDFRQGEALVYYQPWLQQNQEPQLLELKLSEDDEDIQKVEVQRTGGWSKWEDFGIDYLFGVGSPEAVSHVAVEKALKNKNLQLVQMLKFQQQVVNGLNVRVIFNYKGNEDNGLKQGQAVVYYQPWNLQNSEAQVTQLNLNWQDKLNATADEDEDFQKEEAQVVGGWSKWQEYGVDYLFGINSPESISHRTVEKALKSKKLQLLKMVKFQTQVVNGLKIRAQFNWAHLGENDFNQGEAIIYYQPWGQQNKEPELLSLELNGKNSLAANNDDDEDIKKEEVQLPGGWSKWQDFGVDYLFGINSPESITHRAVAKALKQQNLQLLSMVKFQTQVVNGLKVKAVFNYAHFGQNDFNQGQVTIYYQPWGDNQNKEAQIVNLDLNWKQNSLKESNDDEIAIENAHITGGWSQWQDFGVDYLFGIDSPERIAHLAVSKGLKAKNLELVQMTKFQIQVVNGYNVRAKFLYSHAGQNDKNEGEALVYFQPWNLQNQEPELRELDLQDEEVEEEYKKEEAQITGGWSQWQNVGIDYQFGIDSPARLADVAIRRQLKEQGLQLLRLQKIQIQVVNGYNVRAQFQYAHEGQNDFHQGEAIVYYQPWNLQNQAPEVSELKLDQQIGKLSEGEQLDGGWSEWQNASANGKNSVLRIASHSILQGLQKQGLVLLSLEQFQTQVVAGINVKVQFLYANTNDLNTAKVGSAIVYYQPWNLANEEPEVTSWDLNVSH